MPAYATDQELTDHAAGVPPREHDPVPGWVIAAVSIGLFCVVFVLATRTNRRRR